LQMKCYLKVNMIQKIKLMNNPAKTILVIAYL
jgi:hypothetical protein